MGFKGGIKKAYLNFLSDRKNIIFGLSIFFIPFIYELFGHMGVEKNIIPYTLSPSLTIYMQNLIGTDGVAAYLASYYYFFIYLFVISGLAFIIFFSRKPWVYALAILLALTVESVIYIFFPLAPPMRTGAAVPIRINIFHLSDNFVALKYSAFPSGHIMISFLGFLFSKKENFKKCEIFYLANTLIMSFIVIYLGEHYLIDIFGGILLALFSFKTASYIYQKHDLGI